MPSISKRPIKGCISSSNNPRTKLRYDKVIVVWFCLELMLWISSVSIYYGTQSDIRVKSYWHLNLLIAFVVNYERLDILKDSFGHPSKKLLSFEFAQSFYFQFRVSRYITGLNRTSKLKVIIVWICYELPFSILSVSIYYGTQSDMREQVIVILNLLLASVFNYERHDILRDSFGHPSKKLLSFELVQSFCFRFRVSRYITRLNWTSE